MKPGGHWKNAMPLKLVSTNFYFLYHMIALQKLLKKLFISFKTFFSISRHANFCISILSSFSPCQPLLQRIIENKS